MIADLLFFDTAADHDRRVTFRIAAIIAGDGVHTGVRGGAGPFGVELGGDRILSVLVGTAIADEDDVAETVLLQAARGIFEHLTEDGVGNADGPRKAHVTAGRIDAALGRVSDNGRDQCVAETARDGIRIGCDADIVLADRHVGTVLLRPAGGNDDGGLSRGHQIADFLPGESLQKDRVRGLRGGGTGKAKHGDREQVSDHGGLPQRTGDGTVERRGFPGRALPA